MHCGDADTFVRFRPSGGGGAGLRGLVITHVIWSVTAAGTSSGPASEPDATTVPPPLRHSMAVVYCAAVAGATATSPTVLVPTGTATGPVLSASPAPARRVTPSIWRSKRPGSDAGTRRLTTVILGRISSLRI